MVEDWLRCMLDWEPARRGRSYNTENCQPGPILVFEKLENILKAAVVSIFWVDSLVQLSYAINDSMTLTEIQELIERDTGINQQYQLLLLPRGQCADPEKGARQLLNAEESMIVCLFSKSNDDEGSDHQLSESYPELMEIMLSNPRKLTEYRLQKRMWAQSLFFICHQTSLHRKLLHALKIHWYWQIDQLFSREKFIFWLICFFFILMCQHLYDIASGNVEAANRLHQRCLKARNILSRSLC